jgi:hypothetical protein
MMSIYDKPAQSGSQVHPTSTRQTVQGFFSQYTPKKGQQYYRDLAGNIKQVSTPDLGISNETNCPQD